MQLSRTPKYQEREAPVAAPEVLEDLAPNRRFFALGHSFFHFAWFLTRFTIHGVMLRHASSM
jgi:hypothetical protein